MSIIGDFLKLLAAVDTALGGDDDLTRDMIIDHADLIMALSDKCKATDLYKRNQTKIDTLARKLEASMSGDELLVGAWCVMMSKCLDAPTTAHRKVAAVFTVPLVARYLPE